MNKRKEQSGIVDEKMAFVITARSISGNNPHEVRLCPDQFVGKICNFEKDHSDFITRQAAACRPKGVECLLLVLESPHIEEFKAEEPGPAKGKTGGLIRKWIRDVVDREYYNRGVILINAIQRQCSLGLPTCKYRDKMFEALWSQYGEKAFVKRLIQSWQDGDVIMNCCTKGTQSPELRQLVQATIRKTNVCTKPPLRRTHPASWFAGRNRKYEWHEKSL